jgi:hypothetical protein
VNPENRLLLCCAQGHFTGQARADAETLVRQGLDWQELRDSAGAHGLLPLLYYRLRELDAGPIPVPIMGHLEAAYYANGLYNMWLQEELRRVVRALRQEGLEIIVLKGGALCRTAYANLALRTMSDLDLLVRLEDMEHVGRVLEAIGFHLSSSNPLDTLRFHQRFGAGVGWVRSQTGRTAHLDVQHHLLNVDWCRESFHVDMDSLWEAARPLVLDGTHTWQLSAEDTLVHLCLHPLLHHGYALPLMGYVDIDRVASLADLEFWPRLVSRAERFRVRTAMYNGLLGTHRLLGTPVPAEVLKALAPTAFRQRVLRRLAPLDEEKVLRGMAWHPSGARQVLLYAALTDRLRDVGGMVGRILFPSREWLAVRYSLEKGQNTRLYRLVHPLRVARAFLRGLRRPLVKSSLE